MTHRLGKLTLQYGIWELLSHEKKPETHVQAKLLRFLPGCLTVKRSPVYQVSIRYFRFFRFLEVCVTQARFNGKFIINLCDKQVFKTKYSEVSC